VGREAVKAGTQTPPSDSDEHATMPTPAVPRPAPETDSAPLQDTLRTCDWLKLARSLPDGCLDLIYVDPPFNTGVRKSMRAAAYDDRWPDMPAYLDWIRPRLAESRRLLKASGSLLLHCDWRAVHHLRLLLDELFTPDHFVNHLVWRYGLGGSSPRRFARKHDDILFYSKTTQYFFDPPLIPAESQRLAGQMKKATDVLDVPSLNNMATERSGYPTQKPEALLRLLIQAASPPAGAVADFCCGSGTTLVAAKRLGRRYLGCDTNPDATKIARARLRQTPTLGPLSGRDG
jgi:DNA modification methylase